MRPVIAFFLLLCFQFLGKAAHATPHGSTVSYALIQQVEKKLQEEKAFAAQNFLFIKDDGLGEERTLLISTDDNDQEEDSAKKLKLLAKYFLDLSYTILLKQQSFRTIPLSFSEQQVSCIYIEHRVLRI